MLKRAAAIVLVIALFAACFQYFFVCAGFELNHSYIAQNLCVNRHKPWMHCNGKCYFMRRLKQAQDNEKKQTERDNLSRLEISFFQEPVVFCFYTSPVAEIKPTERDGYQNHYSHRYISCILKPPQAPAKLHSA